VVSFGKSVTGSSDVGLGLVVAVVIVLFSWARFIQSGFTPHSYSASSLAML